MYGDNDEEDEVPGAEASGSDLNEQDFSAMMGDEVTSIEMTLPPFVPVLPDRPHVDRGPGGWLREEAARINSRTPRPPARRDRNVWLAVVWPAVVFTFIVAGIVSGLLTSLGWFGVVVYVIVGLAGVVAGFYFYGLSTGPCPAVAPLLERARLEELVAGQVSFPSSSWVLLHDRLLGGTEHRIPFVAVGPAGVVVMSLLPAGPYQWDAESPIVADGVNLSLWLHTRNWEVEQMMDELMHNTVGRWPFCGPVYTLIVDPYQHQPPLGPHGRPLPIPVAPPYPPSLFGRVPIRAIRHVHDHLANLPATLPPTVVQDLVDQVDQLCLPAPSGASTLPT